MGSFAGVDAKLWQWFEDKPPHQWSKAYFRTYPRCDMLLNNGCESFNSAIMPARHMPILSMLEWLMNYAMTRLTKNRDRAISRWRGDRLCPKVRKILEKQMEHLRICCVPLKSKDQNYQVQETGGPQYAVNLKDKCCGCRRWDVSGIPCIHVLRAIGAAQRLKVNDFVHQCYYVDTYISIYSTAVMPIKDRKMWKKSHLPPPLPPSCPSDTNTVGRPSLHHRRPGQDEVVSKAKKKGRGKPPGPSPRNPNCIKRYQKTCRCKFCGEEGHNDRGCKKQKEAEKSEQGVHGVGSAPAQATELNDGTHNADEAPTGTQQKYVQAGPSRQKNSVKRKASTVGTSKAITKKSKGKEIVKDLAAPVSFSQMCANDERGNLDRFTAQCKPPEIVFRSNTLTPSPSPLFPTSSFISSTTAWLTQVLESTRTGEGGDSAGITQAPGPLNFNGNNIKIKVEKESLKKKSKAAVKKKNKK